MCFSATSSFVVAAGLSLSGLVALRNNKRSHLIPLAIVPLGFAIQQASEGVVWLTLHDQTNTMHNLAKYTFLSFAFIVWPVWLPTAVKIYERSEAKKMLLTFCQLIGLLFALAALFFLYALPVTTSGDTGNIGYYFQDSFFKQPVTLAWYVIPTILPFLLIYNRILGTIIGSFAVISLAATYFVLPENLISVWCFMAALVSVIVLALVWSEK